MQAAQAKSYRAAKNYNNILPEDKVNQTLAELREESHRLGQIELSY
jgi:hypothetical protein